MACLSVWYAAAAMETAPTRRLIEDLTERLKALRGYL